MPALTNLGFETSGPLPGQADQWRVTTQLGVGGMLSAGYQQAANTTPILLHSDIDDLGDWTHQETNVVGDATTAPDGTTTADELSFSAVVDEHYVSNSGQPRVLLAGKQYTFGFYMKTPGGGFAQQNVGPSADLGGGDKVYAIFATASNTIGKVGVTGGTAITKVSPELLLLPDGWRRVSITVHVAEDVTVDWRIEAFESSESIDPFDGNNDSVYAWGAFFHEGGLSRAESFSGGWNNDAFVLLFSPGLTATAQYTTSTATPNNWEDFETAWGNSPYPLVLGATVAAAYLGGTVEPFEYGWNQGIYTQRQFTVDAGTNVFTCDRHGLQHGTKVYLVSTVSLPGGLVAYHEYFAVYLTRDTFTLAETFNGPPIDVTDTGAGSHFVARVIFTSSIVIDTLDYFSDEITITGHPFVLGDVLRFQTGEAFYGLDWNTDYHVVSVVGDIIQVSLTAGGTVEPLIDDPGGTHYVAAVLAAYDPLGVVQPIEDFEEEWGAGYQALKTFTASAVTDEISATAHGAINGQAVMFLTTGTLPAPLVANREYFVIAVSTSAFKVAAAQGGSVIDLTSAGSGTHTFTKVLAAFGVPFTADATTEVCTSANHPLTADMAVQLESANVIPGGLARNTTYYVINVTTHTFQLSLTKGGAAFNITSTGTGTHGVVRALAEYDVTATTGEIVEDFEEVRYERQYTFDATTDVFTSAAHGYSDGDGVLLKNIGGAPPAGFNLTVTYYIVASAANTFQLSLAAGGVAALGTDVGSGINSIIGDPDRFWTEHNITI